jgi:hypothetical protein
MALAAALSLGVSPAQGSYSGPQVFGYFQTRFYLEKQIATQEKATSFNVQQLNVFFRQKIGDRWTSFVNFEAVNSYDSEKGWGSFSLEEAWVEYRRNRYLQVKMGLLIPPFNRFNEIKNRMPLHPYIIRPLAYESALAEVVAVEEFVPQQAYFQVRGSHRVKRVGANYALYLGNSVHVVGGDAVDRVTGEDSTDVMMVGGRIGLKHKSTEIGFSVTGEKLNLNDLLPGVADSLEVSPRRLEDVAFSRIGVDFYTAVHRFTLEAEYTTVEFHEDVDDLDVDKEFGYATLGYDLTDQWQVYASFWKTSEGFFITPFGLGGTRELQITGGGFWYRLNERIAFKGQFGKGEYETKDIDVDLSEFDFEHTSVAVSVRF